MKFMCFFSLTLLSLESVENNETHINYCLVREKNETYNLKSAR